MALPIADGNVLYSADLNRLKCIWTYIDPQVSTSVGQKFYFHLPTGATNKVIIYLYGENKVLPMPSHTHTDSGHAHQYAYYAGAYAWTTTNAAANQNNGIDNGYPNQLTIYIDGTDRGAALSGPWGNGSADIATGQKDITTYCNTAGEHYIQFKTGSGYCQAKIVIYAFIGPIDMS